MRLPIAALLALALAVPPSLAANAPEEETVTWYDVELVVFRNLETRSAEAWPPAAGMPEVESSRPLFPPAPAEPADTVALPATADGTAAETPTPWVPLESHQLTGVVDALRRSARYEPILHVAWTQPPLEREDAPRLRVTLPGALQQSTEDDEATIIDAAAQERDPADDEPMPEFGSADDENPLVRPLDGTVQLSVSRYLHLDLDLIYLPDDLNLDVLGETPAATRQWTQARQREREQRHRDILDALARGDITLEEAEILALEPEEPVFQGFRLDQYRRLRSGEIHYFDHPVFGVIVKVTPREVPARIMETTAGQQLR